MDQDSQSRVFKSDPSVESKMERDRLEIMLREAALKHEYLQKEIEVLGTEARIQEELLSREVKVLESDLENSEKIYERNEKVFRRRIKILATERDTEIEKRHRLEEELERLEKHISSLSSFANIENALSLQANSFEEQRILKGKFLEEGLEESGAALFVTYSDYITLLLAVFIILYTASSESLSEMQNSIAKSFSSGRLYNDQPERILKPTNESDKFLVREQIRDMEDEVEDSLKDFQLGDDVQVSTMKDGLIITLKDRVTFYPGDAALRDSSKPVLKKIAGILKINQKNQVTVEVIGHTDNVPIHNEKYPSNWELSISRASNVVRYFVEEEGVPPGQISPKGNAQFQPVASNDTAEGRAANRRVEIKVLSGK